MDDPSGWLWVVLDILAVAALGGALVWATLMWRNRRKDRGAQVRREEATREVYREEAE